MSLSEVFRIHAASRPTKPALVDGDRTFTFAELDAAVDGACHALAARGIGYGDLTAVALKDHAEHLLMLLALARIGATALPVDCRWSLTEKRAVTEHFAADHVLVEPGSELAEGWSEFDPAWFGGGAAPYREPRVGHETPFILSLSSGTTGLPKGPRLTQGQFEVRYMSHFINLGFNAHDRFVSATPLYFGGGRGFAMSTLYAGGTVHLYSPPYEPQDLVAFVNAIGGTSLFLVPTLLRRVLGVAGEGPAMPTLRCLISSGSALYMEERRAIRERITPNLYEMYASTEGGSVTVMGPEEFEAEPQSVGRGCFRVEIEVVDNDHTPLAAGETGKLRYRSPSSPASYFRGDSSEAFRDGWFYPGDLAMRNASGYLFLRGRSKDMIIRGGVNIYPGDIEEVILKVPGVADASVIGVPSPEMGEEIAAYVIAADVDADTIRAACRESLASFKVPRHIRFIDALPRSSLGKVLKPELVKRFESES
ncbi:hypothetical protein DLJ53_11105 [Acuticoccus sediminis]|uniref:Acyl-CoA synthetase (AMP-forming)/AMP-acid ligase II n=1 Tax=Acuticoccus sediminis TaxID=2184697 RepID=A0A8B2NSN2_9HYPH|nr:AMP-binding protein [Acuticoccus sediminis]RAI01931.1 hypothetical protein DLJ53_11105 [Acuticoccus sediminis]